jgi:hypothetical protein
MDKPKLAAEGWGPDRFRAKRAPSPVERARDAPDAAVVLVPFAVEVAPDHDRGYASCAGRLERGRGALGACASCPGVVDQQDGSAVEGTDGFELVWVEGSWSRLRVGSREQSVIALAGGSDELADNVSERVALVASWVA